MRYDNTGGPRGQLACHPAAAQFVLDNAANSERLPARFTGALGRLRRWRPQCGEGDPVGGARLGARERISEDSGVVQVPRVALWLAM